MVGVGITPNCYGVVVAISINGESDEKRYLKSSLKLINESVNTGLNVPKACTQWEENWQSIVPGFEMPGTIILKAQARKSWWLMPVWAHCKIEGYYIRVPETCK